MARIKDGEAGGDEEEQGNNTKTSISYEKNTKKGGERRHLIARKAYRYVKVVRRSISIMIIDVYIYT